MSERIVGNFEQMAVLRIDLLGFARTHAESGGVKTPDVVDDTGSEGITAAGLIGRRMEKRLSWEAIWSDRGHAAVIAS